MYTFLALGCLVLLGGFISYYGDLQGRRWGKRRVSWWGMRPKHTAILITSITGALIVLLSIGTVLAVSPLLRTVILRGETVIQEEGQTRQRLAAENASEHAQIIAANSELHVQEQRLHGARASVEERTAEVQQVTRELQRSQAGLSVIEARYGRLSEQYRDRAVEIASLQRRRANLDTLLGTERTRLVSTRTQRDRLLAENNEYATQNLNYAHDNEGLERQRATLTSDLDTLTVQTHSLQGTKDQLQHDNGALERANSMLSGAVDDLQQKYQSLQTRLRDAQATERALAGTTVEEQLAFRQGRVALRKGAELARRTIDEHRSAGYVTRELDELLRDAGAAARHFGAAPGEDGREVRLTPVEILTPAGDEEDGEAAQVRILSDELAGHDTPVVVRAIVAGNSLAGEQSAIRFDAQDVSRDYIFRRGERIASCVVDARQPLARIVDAVVSFLQTDVKEAAIDAKMVSRVDPETGQDEIGTLGPADLLALTDQIRHRGGLVQVTAIARTSVRAADPLDLDFSVQRARSERKRKGGK